jgi:hypothetical protein
LVTLVLLYNDAPLEVVLELLRYFNFTQSLCYSGSMCFPEIG